MSLSQGLTFSYLFDHDLLTIKAHMSIYGLFNHIHCFYNILKKIIHVNARDFSYGAR